VQVACFFGVRLSFLLFGLQGWFYGACVNFVFFGTYTSIMVRTHTQELAMMTACARLTKKHERVNAGDTNIMTEQMPHAKVADSRLMLKSDGPQSRAQVLEHILTLFRNISDIPKTLVDAFWHNSHFSHNTETRCAQVQENPHNNAFVRFPPWPGLHEAR
jgi:hypothetical protein